MARRATALTQEQRDQLRAQQRELVKASVEQLRSSDGWRSYLRARGAFHSYSVGNVLLIVYQHPTATRVAGFKAWLNLGYCVTKGSKAIRIWAPCPPTQKQLRKWRDSGADPREKPVTGWRLASVFAQDQVVPLPPPAKPVPFEAPIKQITGDSHQDRIAPLIALAQEIDYTVVFTATGRADGYCDPKSKRIVIADRLDPNAQLAVLIHELGHALLRSEPTADQLNYAQEELIVESIAFCVCSQIKLDTHENSIPYLTNWAEYASLEVLEQTAQLADRLARRIEDRLLIEPATREPADEKTLDPPQPVAP